MQSHGDEQHRHIASYNGELMVGKAYRNIQPYGGGDKGRHITSRDMSRDVPEVRRRKEQRRRKI